MNRRELTTIILGLRVWQNELGHHSIEELTEFHPELHHDSPLSVDEIDALIVRLEGEHGE